MKKQSSKIRFQVLIYVAIGVLILTFTTLSLNVKNIGENRKYHNDVKIISLSTNIEVSQDDIILYTIKGNILRFVTDPLTMYDADGNKISYADDTYHFINQDSHCVVYNDKTYEMVGEFKILGDTYSIYQDGELIAVATFNALNTHGELKDTSGNLLADYSSLYIFYDYDVRIKDNNLFDDEAILMIFSSYYSDQHFDNSQ